MLYTVYVMNFVMHLKWGRWRTIMGYLVEKKHHVGGKGEFVRLL